ncbi:peptidoglycan editing factor PgeF [Evansella sp. AB-rgal1]|uniref:peptidoglycan editing factor PgeF n=1 Tax=Evansella sp. AB-rgal1 TaxID=3242696 RepID=UPI00359E9234
MKNEPFSLVQKQFLVLESWKHIPNIVAGFTTKNGGTSDSPFRSFNLGLHVNDDVNKVIDNRKLLSSLLGFRTTNWVCSDQVHGNNIEKVTIKDAGSGVVDYQTSIKSTDGLYTDEPNILLTSGYADCVPLFFCEPNKKLIGVAHAGWKGTVKDIAGEMIRKWQLTEGINPSDVYTVIGPSIGGCCYVVDDHVIDFVNNALSQKDPRPYQEISKGQYALDLKRVNKLLMLAAGIREENIIISSYCTSCSDNLFFSHRRDKGKTGRMLSFLGWKQEK